MSAKRRAPLGLPADRSTQRRPQPPHGPPLPASSSIKNSQSTQRSNPYSSNRDDAFVAPSQAQEQLRQQPRPSGDKVAIPRLSRDPNDSAISTEKARVSHACEPCRQRKTKCSGERPVCKHCEDFQISCFYADGKRDRTKKEFGNMAGRIEDYERLLRELSLRTSGEDQSLIRKALEIDNGGDVEKIPSDSSSRKSQAKVTSDGVGELAGEHRVSARVGSTGDLDNIDEDYNRSAASRATGFLGKNSEVVWMQRLNRWANEPDSEGGSSTKSDQSTEHDNRRPTSAKGTGPSAQKEQSASGSTYHCDDLPVIVTDQVDPFELPPKQVAHQLFQSYLDTVHPAFPILGKLTFISQYQTFAHRESLNTGNNWRAILNMIFAIAAKYSHLIRAEWRGDDRDHLIYFTRARMLGFNGESILAHPELQQIQISGLMAFYLTAISQVNRAWAVSGIAIRQAITLGLNLQNNSKEVHDASREIRYRLWWALCSTERTLAVMTGRTTSFLETDCAVPLPLAVDEETLFGGNLQSSSQLKVPAARQLSSRSSREHDPSSSTSMSDDLPDSSEFMEQHDTELGAAISPNDASCFLFNVKLSILTDEVMNGLYRAGASDQTWAQVQKKITKFNSGLMDWVQALPAVFDFRRKQQDQQYLRHRLYLGFAYYSTRTIVNRPALCRIDRKIPGESGKAKELNRTIAARCVHSAKGVLEMLPNEPNTVGLYRVAPWWRLVHHLVQASTVLMLELSFRADHMPNEAEDILEAAKKAVIWLRAMSEEDVAARRAWKLCDRMLRKVAPKVGRTVNDIPSAYSSSVPYGMSPFDVPAAHDLTFPRLATPTAYERFYTDSPFERHSFQPQTYTAYDEFLSSTLSAPPTTSPPFGSMFPSASHMDALGSRITGNTPPAVRDTLPRWDV